MSCERKREVKEGSSIFHLLNRKVGLLLTERKLRVEKVLAVRSVQIRACCV